ncbi:entericidin A/B family lipoprotein [Pelagicoccus albus]|uniref:Entericidin A/B family lipoprotein n=1 Tax=Pelagicoccus albus TaxID=415222 RepID=A0A7X1E7H2_9BACT|nr:entericidin A/B family lipoprotein [Pelagicoccus albus]MBC2605196.1 entericidin A/B family lipoprotein [Pelagicoccus albus]
MTKPLKYILLAAVSSLTVIFATGCSTVDGIGKDVEKLGEEVQDAAD